MQTALSPGSSDQNPSSRSLPATVADGVIFDAWQWKFTDIQNNLQAFSDAGYKAIEVSPIQPMKQWDSSTAWYLFYQPCDITIADGTDGNSHNPLGTEQDFINLCTAANNNYGIKIIVDVVLNHTADNGSVGNFDSHVPSYIQNNKSSWFHNLGTVESIGGWQNRYAMTQGSLGNGPDWKTQDSTVQSMMIAFLNRCVSDGAGGFRFDAAKSIETNVNLDSGQSWSGTFWSNIQSNVSNYSNLFVYGEVLPDTNDNETGYQTFMRTTTTGYLNQVSSALDNQNLTGLLNNVHSVGSTYNEDATKSVVYIENWDNYEGSVGTNTSGFSYNKRLLANAIMTARAGMVNIVFGRPNENLYKDSVLVVVNQFRNTMAGTTDYLRYPSNSILAVERQLSGVGQGMVLINSAGSQSISVATALPNGSYTDHGPSGNVFTVSNGTLTGTVPGTTAVTLYNATGSVAAPTFNPGAGQVSSGTAVTLSSTTSGSTIYYTTDGSTPTTSSSHGTSGAASASVTVTSAVTIKAIAVLSGNSSSVSSASYTISSGYASNYATMYLRGTMNSWGSTAMNLVADHVWQVSVTLSASTAYQYKFDAYANWATNWGDTNADGVANSGGSNINYTTSSAGSYTFTFNDSTLAYSVSGGTPTTATPTFSPGAGAVTSGTSVTISSTTSGATIYYTTDGSTPTTSSSHGTLGAASAAVTVSAAETINAMAVASGYNNSAVGSATYTIAVAATPTFNPAPGTVAAGTVVTMSSTTSGSTIYYTTDGSTPTTGSSHGAAGAGTATYTVNASVTLKAIAVATGYTNSAVASGTYNPSSGTANFTVTFVNNGSAQNISFPGDANSWSLTANTLSAAANQTYTITWTGAVTTTVLAQGSSTTAMELKVVNGTSWSSQWGFGSWTKSSNITLSDSNRQIAVACSTGQTVNLTINVSTSTLTATVQ